MPAPKAQFHGIVSIFIQGPGGQSVETQYFEAGKITNWALRTSKPLQSLCFLYENAALQGGVKENLH